MYSVLYGAATALIMIFLGFGLKGSSGINWDNFIAFALICAVVSSLHSRIERLENKK